MIEKIDARLARLAARHTELSTAIQNASVELAQVEGAHAHLTDLKKEIEEAAAVAEKEPRSIFHPPEAEGRVATEADLFPTRFLHADQLEAQRTVTRIAAAVEEADVFPVEQRLQRELARNREATT